MNKFRRHLKNLNDEQLKAVLSDSNRIRIIASAGSGKTLVLALRILRLLNSRVSYRNILCVTFTRTAGLELKERLIKFTPIGKKIFSNTFHAFCIQILRKYGERIGYASNFTIISESRRQFMIEQSAKVFNYTKSMTKINKAIKNLQIIYGEKPKTNDSTVEGIVNDYIFNLKRNNIIDIDLILYFTYELLKANDDIAEYYREMYSHILVDEAQDTNDIQRAIIDVIRPANEFIVGDDKQAIYGWNNANLRHLVEYDKYFPESETIILKNNYRNTIPIVTAANLIISDNKGQIPSQMLTEKEGKPIDFIEAINEGEQNNSVTAEILGLTNYYSFKDICVLARTNKELLQLASVLKEYEIPYNLPSVANSFTKDTRVNYILNVIATAINTSDEISILLALNYPNQVLDYSQVLKVKEKCSNLGITLWEGICSFKFKAQDKVDKFIMTIKNIKEYIKTNGSTVSVIRYTINLIGMNGEELIKLIEDAHTWENSQKEYANPYNISFYLDYFKTKDIQDKIKNKMRDENKVSLLTVHQAKGLEFSIVIILGMIEGNFPLKAGDVEEECRIAYVAYTRAKEKLILSSYKIRRNHRNLLVDAVKSRFIEKLKA